jgi:phosphoglycerate dehydrogenase-like enzyme
MNMQNLNIVFKSPLNPLWNEVISELRAAYPAVNFHYKLKPDNWQEGSLTEKMAFADAVVAGSITEVELNISKRLKTVFVPFTGVNTMPLQALKARGVNLTNVHGNAEIVAERAIALAMAILGKVVFYHNELKAGRWHRSHEEKYLWTSLKNLPCTILGFGYTGQAVLQYLRPFTEEVSIYRNKPDKKTASQTVFETNKLEDALKDSELVFCCLPLTVHTKGLFNRKNIHLLNDKYLVNIGRAAVFEEKALYDSLSKDGLKGAALDVWYQYPSKSNKEPVFPSEYPFHELDNLIMSPHKAAHSQAAISGNIQATKLNLEHFLKNGRPIKFVDPDEGY